MGWKYGRVVYSLFYGLFHPMACIFLYKETATELIQYNELTEDKIITPTLATRKRYQSNSSLSSNSLKICKPSSSSSSLFLILHVQIQHVLPSSCQVQAIFIGFRLSSSNFCQV